MKKREILLWVLLSLATCGIFYLVWIAFVANDLRELANEPEEMSGGIVVLLSVVTCGIYLIYWYYKAGKSIEKARFMRNMPQDNSLGLIYIILALIGLGIVSVALIQNDINQIIDYRPVNNGEGFDNPINYYKDSKPYNNQSYYNNDPNYDPNNHNVSNPNYDNSNNSFLNKDYFNNIDDTKNNDN